MVFKYHAVKTIARMDKAIKKYFDLFCISNSYKDKAIIFINKNQSIVYLLNFITYGFVNSHCFRGRYRRSCIR